MSKLTTTTRKRLKPKEFALPKSRKFPVPDKSHAANAKARAAQMEEKGKISETTKEKIDAKANKVLKPKGKAMPKAKGKAMPKAKAKVAKAKGKAMPKAKAKVAKVAKK